MLYFYQNPAQILEMGKNAFEKVKEYNWERYGENLARVYQQFN